MFPYYSSSESIQIKIKRLQKVSLATWTEDYSKCVSPYNDPSNVILTDTKGVNNCPHIHGKLIQVLIHCCILDLHSPDLGTNLKFNLSTVDKSGTTSDLWGPILSLPMGKVGGTSWHVHSSFAFWIFHVSICTCYHLIWDARTKDSDVVPNTGATSPTSPHARATRSHREDIYKLITYYIKENVTNTYD